MMLLSKQEIVNLINDPATVKVLVTVDRQGVPHAVVKDSFWINAAGQLLYLELLESSRTNKNMIASLWFEQKVTIVLLGNDGISYQIKGRPVKTHVSGPVFREQYVRIREKLGDTDLAAVWVIEPEEIINESYTARRREEEDRHPYFKHLDRLAK